MALTREDIVSAYLSKPPGSRSESQVWLLSLNFSNVAIAAVAEYRADNDKK